MIKIEKLVKLFGGNQKKALKMLAEGKNKDEVLAKTRSTVGVYKVDFTVHEGEVFVVMGLSGSGKSTLVRCINRLIEPTKGKIFIGEDEITAADSTTLRNIRREQITMVFQRFGLFPHLTVGENVAYGLRVRGVNKEERSKKAAEVLNTVGLKEWIDSPIDSLSGGMQQRVGLARALVTDPTVLLMDEPFSALDPLIRKEMQEELVQLQSKLLKTIVFITHDLDEALRIGDRIAIMKDGVIHQIGTPEEILRSPVTDYVAEFVQNVNPWGIITAEQIMERPDAVVKRKTGPRVALRRMRDKKLSSLFVIDDANKFQGIITADDAVTAIKNDEDIEHYLETDIPKVNPDTLLKDIAPLGAEAKYPIPVINEENHLLGIIVRATILSGLTVDHPADENKTNRNQNYILEEV